ncbi:Mu transposase C-terminal domain-containing protein [Actinoallomurus sp. NPDC050550]|uniref:Mu transposase C-terminal domain-containing protein n=1 Tax=Actinoallomurus sp. NPDC050550 TaxID=3154937 RepID=UPI0033E1C5DB
MLRLDQGLEFAAAAVKAATAALGTVPHVLPGYSPNQKGKIERAFLTVDEMLLCTLPGYTGGPREVNGRLAGPLDDRVKARVGYGDAAAAGQQAGLPLGLETFARIFGNWVAAYNTEHVHSELGMTPAQAWAADASPIEDVPAEHLRHLLLAGRPRTIGPHGIRFRNLKWLDPGGLIRERRGTQVQIRYMPHDDRFIDVYLDGEFLATCYPTNALTAEQEAEFYAAARAQEKQAAAQRASARRRGRMRLAALSATDTSTESVRKISPAEAERLNRTGGGGRPRPETSTSLLGIVPIGPIEPVDLADLDVDREHRPW